MNNYGATAGTRRYERELVAREYPSIVQYRRILTPYEQQKAEANKFFYGKPGSIREVIGRRSAAEQVLILLLVAEGYTRYRGGSFIQDTLVPTVRQLVGDITGRF
jgi:hypothetical protein